jgi:uncharacterized protein (TIGR02246 family)
MQVEPKTVCAKELKPMSAQTPEQCDELFGKYVNARDLDNLVALYEEQASLMNEDGTAVSGIAAIRNTMQGIFATLPEATITMKVLQVAKAGDDLAVLYNDWSLVGKGADGAEVLMNHKAIEIVRRQSDGLGDLRSMILMLADEAADSVDFRFIESDEARCS